MTWCTSFVTLGFQTPVKGRGGNNRKKGILTMQNRNAVLSYLYNKCVHTENSLFIMKMGGGI